MRANPTIEVGAGARTFIAALVLLACLVGVTSRLWQFGVASPFTDPIDFRAFYCAGAAVERRANPYRLEPVRSCQRRVLTAAGLRLDEDFVLPAPLPPYALMAFAGFALLPYRFASALWMSLNIIAVIVALVLTSRLSGARPAYIALSLFLSVAIVCLSLGQVVPIVLAAALFTALCARRGNGSGAAVGATIAALEPHLALPVWLALALFVPVARKPIAVALLALGALSIVPGVALNVEYVRSVLPRHAHAELLNLEGQYGLSAALAAARIPAEAALRAGTAWYAVMLAFGLALGVALHRRFDDAAYFVMVPLAAVVFGGPFLHIQQTAVAIPLGFMLLSRLPRHSVPYYGVAIAVVLLAIPWPLADMAFTATPAPGIGRTASAPQRHRHAAPNESIEIQYAAFIERFERRRDKHPNGALIARKLPTWFALLVLLISAVRLAFARGPFHGARRSRRAVTALVK